MPGARLGHPVSLADPQTVEGISAQMARAVYDFFHEGG